MAVGSTQPIVIIDLKIHQLSICKVYDSAKVVLLCYFSGLLRKNRGFLGLYAMKYMLYVKH